MATSRTRTKVKRQLKAGEQPGLNRHWRGLFLDLLAETSNVSESARKAGINPSRAYKVRREEPEFAKAWLAALYEGYIHLEMEVVRRLREGDMEAGTSGKYDFANAIRLLTATPQRRRRLNSATSALPKCAPRLTARSKPSAHKCSAKGNAADNRSEARLRLAPPRRA